MTTDPARRRRLRRVSVGLLATVVSGAAAIAVATGPPASGAGDPCSASGVARTAGAVVKSMGDYLDSHPETNRAMTALLQQQAGPQSLTLLKTYFDANPKVATDMQQISQPLTGLSLQCKLPISLPQVMGMMQQMQGGVGLPATPAGTNPLSGPSRNNTVG